ncbi:AcrR family transcriptional regulator [Jiangella mangrovi]|uniref:AcrR family transcriptional regulator n=1 Tax=Jiangella mangrovi TaxID=1524084 RepID=A0A7W9GMD8_9ACTN|nr:AcrR family transcriptional regulator [Jiangella mangrovi]
MPEQKTRRRLTRDDWADAALAAIAEGGLAAVAVEPLAVGLGTTKGSFYWHFANRDALLDAALARWEERTTTDVIGEITALPDEPAGRLRRLVTRVVAIAERDPVGPALLASAADPRVAAALDRVTRARVGLIVTLFEGMGFAPDAAHRRALLAYSAYLGHAELAHSTPGVLPADPEQRQAYLDDVLTALTAR